MARVLLIEDDPQVRGLLEAMLRFEGLEVSAFGDGEGGLQALEGEPPDLVLLDVVLPGVDGFEVCRRLKEHPETRLTPVVLLTGLADVDNRVRGIEAGADDFLTKPFERVELLARVRSLLRLKAYTDELDRAESVLCALARSIEARDPCTQGHCERLSTYGAALGEAAGLGDAEIKALVRAGVVHDVGKIAVPDSILLKPTRLTDDEWLVMRQHPLTGEEICRPIKSFRLVLPIIRHHHEKQDGTGYPDGLRGDQVPMTARVLQVVDVFDALTTERPYKAAKATPEAMAILREEVARGWWDGELVELFGGMLERGPALSRLAERGRAGQGGWEGREAVRVA